MIPISAAVALLIATATPDEPAKQRCSPDAVGSFSSSGAEAEFRKAESDWAASISTGEAVLLRRVTSLDFTAVFNGEVMSRAALIAGAEKRLPGTSSSMLTSMRVDVYGPVAIAEGDEIWSVKASGNRQHIVWSDAWVHCGGEWWLKVSTAVGTPAG